MAGEGAWGWTREKEEIKSQATLIRNIRENGVQGDRPSLWLLEGGRKLGGERVWGYWKKTRNTKGSRSLGEKNFGSGGLGGGEKGPKT